MAKAKTKTRRGRPTSKLPLDVYAKLGDPPAGEPLKLARWFSDTIAVLTAGVLRGEPWRELLEMVRASAGAAGRVLSPDIIFTAQQRLNRDRDAMNNTAQGGRVVARKDVVVAQSTGAVRRDSARR